MENILFRYKLLQSSRYELRVFSEHVDSSLELIGKVIQLEIMR